MQPILPPYQRHDLMPFGYVPSEFLETCATETVSATGEQPETLTAQTSHDGSGVMGLATVGGFLFAIATLGASTAMLAQALSPATIQSQSPSLTTSESWNF